MKNWRISSASTVSSAPLSETSFGYLNEMSNEMKLNKSEIIRRCLVWLSKQYVTGNVSSW
jgi:predicted deacetylase